MCVTVRRDGTGSLALEFGSCSEDKEMPNDYDTSTRASLWQKENNLSIYLEAFLTLRMTDRWVMHD